MTSTCAMLVRSAGLARERPSRIWSGSKPRKAVAAARAAVGIARREVGGELQHVVLLVEPEIVDELLGEHLDIVGQLEDLRAGARAADGLGGDIAVDLFTGADLELGEDGHVDFLRGGRGGRNGLAEGGRGEGEREEEEFFGVHEGDEAGNQGARNRTSGGEFRSHETKKRRIGSWFSGF